MATPVEVVNMARAEFSDEVIDVLKESGIAECEPGSLTRDDVNSEFKMFGFTVRKQLYFFFISVGLIEDTSDTRAAMDTSSSSAGTEPCRSTEEYLNETAKPARTSKLFKKFQVPPKRPIPKNKNLEDYPGSIPDPFPLSSVFKMFLESPREVFTENRAVFLQVVREVCAILEKELARRPGKEELVATAKKLCQEYPVLQCGDNDSYGAFLEALKKRCHNAAQNKRYAVQGIKKKIAVQPSESTAFASYLSSYKVPDAMYAKDVIKTIRTWPGDDISKRALDRYPFFTDMRKFLGLFAVLQDTTVSLLLQEAERGWMGLSANVDGLPFDRLRCSLEKIAEEPSSYIFRQGVEGPAKKRTDEKQPYLWVPESLESEFEVTVVVDKLPFMMWPANNTECHCATSLLLLLAVYFVLNLEYPKGARKTYTRLQHQLGVSLLDLSD